MNVNDQQARDILKKHCALWGDKKYEPAHWVIDAMKEAAALSCAPTGVKKKERSHIDADNDNNEAVQELQERMYGAANPAASAQPVAWISEYGTFTTANSTASHWRNTGTRVTALYASPPPVPADVGLTDEEIRAAFKSVYGLAFMSVSDWHFARAIIAAMKAKGAKA